MESREHATTANLQLLREKLDSGRLRSARLMIHSLHPAEIARLLESVDLRTRTVLWEMVDSDDEGDVLVEVNDEVRDGQRPHGHAAEVHRQDQDLRERPVTDEQREVAAPQDLVDQARDAGDDEGRVKCGSMSHFA